MPLPFLYHYPSFSRSTTRKVGCFQPPISSTGLISTNGRIVIGEKTSRQDEWLGLHCERKRVWRVDPNFTERDDANSSQAPSAKLEERRKQHYVTRRDMPNSRGKYDIPPDTTCAFELGSLGIFIFEAPRPGGLPCIQSGSSLLVDFRHFYRRGLTLVLIHRVYKTTFGRSQLKLQISSKFFHPHSYRFSLRSRPYSSFEDACGHLHKLFFRLIASFTFLWPLRHLPLFVNASRI